MFSEYEDKKSLYIIAGCNGAGKTTASWTILPKFLDCKEFVNADEIAKGISPFNPSSVLKIFLNCIFLLLICLVFLIIPTAFRSVLQEKNLEMTNF